jgi:hypothetical protein
MAAVESSNGARNVINSDLTLVKNDQKCICCKHLKRELQEALLERPSAHKIIELLKEETYSTAPSASITSRDGQVSHTLGKITNDPERKTTGNWKTVESTKRNYNKQPKAPLQQPFKQL